MSDMKERCHRIFDNLLCTYEDCSKDDALAYLEHFVGKIRNEAIEEAARKTEILGCEDCRGDIYYEGDIAARIRELKDTVAV